MHEPRSLNLMYYHYQTDGQIGILRPMCLQTYNTGILIVFSVV